ncbi:alpha/beta hydrolase family protein [Kribbella italica]|uniref:Acetyl esterase/lipase n=1 Tax=Kribbella italica TaxID=1540520 RepID=A0A7W9MUF7_9ACTN|nr:alpha/beta fold hydrolase [Kribbella italica]MBB5836791.1 acetyl esterase/lipase [Kribbella italica]
MISRRRVLVGGSALLAGLSGCSNPSAPAEGAQQIRYGDDESQVADLFLPPGSEKVPAVVVIHGGFWMSGYGKELATPLAEDLAKNGVAGYAIEYRRVGNGGGWPATFDDVGAAIDALADQPRIAVDRVVAVGHSAGGHLAVWAAARSGRVMLKGAVSQAGVLDLINAYDAQVGGDAVVQLMGATPTEDKKRYAASSPYEQLPLKVPVALVHGTRDGQVPLDQSQRYLAAAQKAGGVVTLTELPGVGHFELIDPKHDAWATCRKETLRLLS